MVDAFYNRALFPPWDRNHCRHPRLHPFTEYMATVIAYRAPPLKGVEAPEQTVRNCTNRPHCLVVYGCWLGGHWSVQLQSVQEGGLVRKREWLRMVEDHKKKQRLKRCRLYIYMYFPRQRPLEEARKRHRVSIRVYFIQRHVPTTHRRPSRCRAARRGSPGPCIWLLANG